MLEIYYDDNNKNEISIILTKSCFCTKITYCKRAVRHMDFENYTYGNLILNKKNINNSTDSNVLHYLLYIFMQRKYYKVPCHLKYLV